MGMFDGFGANLTAGLMNASNPFGLGAPQGMTQEQFARMPYLDLGAAMLANSSQRPMEALGNALQSVRQNGMDMGTKRLWAQQMQSQLQDAQDERENRKKLTSALQGLLSPVTPTGGGAAAGAEQIADMPSTGPGAPFAQPVPQPMQQGQGAPAPGQQFTPQQLFQAKYWLGAGAPEKAMEALFKPGSNWQQVTTDDGVFLFDPQNPGKMTRLGDRPARNEGEGRPFLQADKLRDDYTTQTKPYADLRNMYQRMLAAYQGAGTDQTGASDIAMVFSYMKMLDPTSVVREGEQATAQNAAGVPDQIRMMWNKVLKGERLPQSVRDAFMDQAGLQYEQQLGTFTQTRKTFQDLATSNQLDPDLVAPDYTYGVKPFKRGSKAPNADTPDPLGIR